MRDPPPRPLDTKAPNPRKDHMLNIPYRPPLGSQKLFWILYGLRGNEWGGNGLPRSSRQTFIPASERRYAMTDPPNPDPMTTASKCSWAIELYLTAINVEW